MKWKDKLEEWITGDYPKLNKNLKKSFFWETSPINQKLNTVYNEKFIEDSSLDKMKQNYTQFSEYIKKTKNKNVLSFYNLKKDSLLVIPYPKKNKNFVTLKQFMENASQEQQKIFWKKVTSSIIRMLNKHPKVWVSTHGKGVPYLHVRIDTKPKYYITKEYAEM